LERSPRDDDVEAERRRLDTRLEADVAGTAVTEQARREAEVDRERLRALVHATALAWLRGRRPGNWRGSSVRKGARRGRPA